MVDAPTNQAIPWPHAAVFALDADAAAAKRRAIGRFASQIAPTPAGRPRSCPPTCSRTSTARQRAVLPDHRPPTSAPVRRFADLYAGGDDPWQTRTSWYERRKRDVVLACLPRDRYAHAAEPGCGLGR